MENNEKLMAMMAMILDQLSVVSQQMSQMTGMETRIRASITSDVSILMDETANKLKEIEENFFTYDRISTQWQQTRPSSVLTPLQPNGRNSRSHPLSQPAPH